MSNLCKTTLCTGVQQNASNVVANTCIDDILFSATAINSLATNRSTDSCFLTDLFGKTTTNGQIAYFDDAKTPIIYSNGRWLGLDGRTTENSYVLENQLWTWGSNESGGLGIGSASYGSAPCPILEVYNSKNWAQVSSSKFWFNSAALKTSGQIWSWGLNSSGQLGDGTTVNKCSPVREISSSTDWCQVSSGCRHTTAIKTSGQLWVWGAADCGRLGDGTTVNKCSPVREISSSTDWCQVSAGAFHTAAIKTSGQLWSWGYNSCGRLGDGTTVNKCSPVREITSSTDWCQVSAGAVHTAALKTTGQIWTWGYNSCGRLGDGTTVNKCSPVREITSSTDWRQVAAGNRHTTTINISGQLWSWGYGGNGQLANELIANRCSPIREITSSTDWCYVSAGVENTAAIKTSGQLWSWGFNFRGNLGDGTTTLKASPVREITSSTDWCQVSAGYTTAAIKSLFVLRG